MSMAGLTLPAMTVADPEMVGEGSIDPLGLAQIADRLAEHLAPGVRARMGRIRLLTASAVGALAADDLFDHPAADGGAGPSICFEWLVLEAFARRPGDGALDAAGIPGSTKVRLVLTEQKRLAARNYLKSPSVMGFTGVYLPLARAFGVLDSDRRAGKHTDELTLAWEHDQQLPGFTAGTPGSAGRKLRDDIAREIQRSLVEQRCACPPGSKLWATLTSSLHPRHAGTREKKVLRSWLLSPDSPVRREIAAALDTPDALSEPELVELLLGTGLSIETQVRLEAAQRYERMAWLLSSAFQHLRHTSYLRGSSAVTPTSFVDDDTLATLVRDIPKAVHLARERLEQVEPTSLPLFDERITEPFGAAVTPADFVEAVMRQHEQVQAAKFPGKRPWFDPHGNGWVVRPQYRAKTPVDLDEVAFVHPYRLASLQQFMADLR